MEVLAIGLLPQHQYHHGIVAIVVIRIFELEYSAGMFSLMEYCHEDIAYTPSLVKIQYSSELYYWYSIVY